MGLTSFGVRDRWLRLLLKLLPSRPDIFCNLNDSEKLEETQYLFGGIGNKQVPAIKDWGVGIGLIEEISKGYYRLTDIGEIISKYDPQLEEQASYWVIHHNLCMRPLDMWFYSHFANNFGPGMFTRDEVRESLKTCTANKYSESTIEKMALEPLRDTLMNTKLGEELGLFKVVDAKDNLYERIQPTEKVLHPTILAYMLHDWACRNDRLSVNTLEFMAKGAIGNYLCLSQQALHEYLSKIHDRFTKKVLWVSFTAGLNSVTFDKDIRSNCVLESYYIERQQGLSPLESLKLTCG